MTPREQLHQLIDELPDYRLDDAEEALRRLASPDAPFVPLASAPHDDEPDDDDQDDGLTEARAEAERGDVIDHAEALRRWVTP